VYLLTTGKQECVLFVELIGGKVANDFGASLPLYTVRENGSRQDCYGFINITPGDPHFPHPNLDSGSSA